MPSERPVHPVGVIHYEGYHPFYLPSEFPLPRAFYSVSEGKAILRDLFPDVVFGGGRVIYPLVGWNQAWPKGWLSRVSNSQLNNSTPDPLWRGAVLTFGDARGQIGRMVLSVNEPPDEGAELIFLDDQDTDYFDRKVLLTSPSVISYCAYLTGKGMGYSFPHADRVFTRIYDRRRYRMEGCSVIWLDGGPDRSGRYYDADSGRFYRLSGERIIWLDH